MAHEEEDQFYLTLLSNGSMSIYPNNTTTKFTTHLPRQIRLTGNWEAGLVEFHYPCTYYQFDNDTVITVEREEIQPLEEEKEEEKMVSDQPSISEIVPLRSEIVGETEPSTTSQVATIETKPNPQNTTSPTAGAAAAAAPPPPDGRCSHCCRCCCSRSPGAQ